MSSEVKRVLSGKVPQPNEDLAANEDLVADDTEEFAELQMSRKSNSQVSISRKTFNTDEFKWSSGSKSRVSLNF